MGAMLGEPGGRAPLLGALKVMKGRLWGRASLFMGAQMGKLEWSHLLGTFKDIVERGSEGGGISLCGRSVKGTWREGSHAGDPEG